MSRGRVFVWCLLALSCSPSLARAHGGCDIPPTPLFGDGGGTLLFLFVILSGPAIWLLIRWIKRRGQLKP